MAMKKNKTGHVSIMILQNGKPVASSDFSISKKQELFLSSKENSPLSLPLYPLSSDIKIMEIKNKKIFLVLTEAWSGIVLSKGEVFHLDSHLREDQIFEMEISDYATIYLNDLNVLVKVYLPFKEKSIPLDQRYAPSFFSLFIKDKYEKIAFFVALFAVLFLGTSSIMGLIIRPFERPTTFEDLADSYTLPFIDPDNLRTSPEALQESLNRKAYIKSVIDYYRTFASLYLGINFPSTSHFSLSTKKRYEELYAKHEALIKEKVILNRSYISKKNNYQSAFAIPAIYGESFQEKIYRVTKKIKDYHQSLNQSLESRKKISLDFKNDPEYDWTKYMDLSEESNLSETLSKIKVFKQMSNEDAMYHEAKSLAFKANQMQKIQLKHTEKTDSIALENTKPVAVEEAQQMISLQNENFPKFADDAFEKLIGSQIKEKALEGILEPLIGLVKKEDVSEVFRKNQYKLNLCYEKALRRNHILKGLAAFTFRVSSTGIVSELSLDKSTIEDPILMECVKKSLYSWTFPKPEKGSIKISHTFFFEPKSG